MANDVPKEPGWYFAKWKIASEGTRNGDDLTPSDELECVRVVVNTVDQEDDEHLMVEVGGVEQWQALENFYWIGPVPIPAR